MRIEIRSGPGDQAKKHMISSEVILRYLITDDDKIDTLIMCDSAKMSLAATDLSLYEALGSIKQYDAVKINKLAKFIEAVEIMSYGSKKPVLTHERVEELRKSALKDQNNKTNYGGK